MGISTKLLCVRAPRTVPVSGLNLTSQIQSDHVAVKSNISRNRNLYWMLKLGPEGYKLEAKAYEVRNNYACIFPSNRPYRPFQHPFSRFNTTLYRTIIEPLHLKIDNTYEGGRGKPIRRKERDSDPPLLLPWFQA